MPLKFSFSAILLLLLTLNLCAGPVTPGDINSLVKRSSSTGFVKNIGQMKGPDGKKAPVLYSASIGAKRIFLTHKGLSYVTAEPLTASAAGSQFKKDNKDTTSSSLRMKMESIDMTLAGADIRAENITEIAINKAAGQINFYDAVNGEAHLQVASALKVKNVYPGIDWILYFKYGADGIPCLKYDFLINPGADVGKIKLRYSSNAKLQKNSEGSIVVREPPPVCLYR